MLIISVCCISDVCFVVLKRADDKACVEMELYVNKSTAPRLNSGKDCLDDILVLHLQGGKDLFVSFPLLLLIPPPPPPLYRPVEGGGVFPGPATFGGPRQRSKILKRVFQMASF